MPTPDAQTPPSVTAPVYEPAWGNCLLVAGCLVPLIFLAVGILSESRDDDRLRDARVAYLSQAGVTYLATNPVLNPTAKPDPAAEAELARKKQALAVVEKATDQSGLTAGPMTVTALTLAAMLIAIGRRLRAPGAYRVLRGDPRPPVLYLRPFRADTAGLTATHTNESRLLKRLWKIGPVVAIGRPGESLPPAGAARFYVSNDEWQEAVLTLMRGSRLVVMGAGQTRGFHWELAAVRDLDQPEKTVLYIPQVIALKPGVYAEFRADAEVRLRTSLPATLGRRRCFVLFDRQWSAHAVDLAPGDDTDGYAARAKGLLAFWELRVLSRHYAKAPAVSADREPVETLLRRLDEQVQRPPRFRLPMMVWLLAAALTLAFAVRPGWLFPAVEPGWVGRHPALAAVGAALLGLPWITGLLAALALYIRAPRRPVEPVLGFGAAFGAAVIVCRSLF